jgi:hypothetical protein
MKSKLALTLFLLSTCAGAQRGPEKLKACKLSPYTAFDGDFYVQQVVTDLSRMESTNGKPAVLVHHCVYTTHVRTQPPTDWAEIYDPSKFPGYSVLTRISGKMTEPVDAWITVSGGNHGHQWSCSMQTGRSVNGLVAKFKDADKWQIGDRMAIEAVEAVVDSPAIPDRLTCGYAADVSKDQPAPP